MVLSTYLLPCLYRAVFAPQAAPLLLALALYRTENIVLSDDEKHLHHSTGVNRHVAVLIVQTLRRKLPPPLRTTSRYEMENNVLPNCQNI